MKSSVKNFRKVLNGLFEAGHVDRAKRKARGYDEANADVDYTDIKEETEQEGVTQSKRKVTGYALEEPADYDVAESVDENDVPMALRVKLYSKAPADDPMMGPPNKMVDLMGGDDGGTEDMGISLDQEDEAVGDEDDFGGVQSDVDKAPGDFPGVQNAFVNADDHHPDDIHRMAYLKGGKYKAPPKLPYGHPDRMKQRETKVPSLKSVLNKKK
jgi:hypothetical protein